MQVSVGAEMRRSGEAAYLENDERVARARLSGVEADDARGARLKSVVLHGLEKGHVLLERVAAKEDFEGREDGRERLPGRLGHGKERHAVRCIVVSIVLVLPLLDLNVVLAVREDGNDLVRLNGRCNEHVGADALVPRRGHRNEHTRVRARHACRVVLAAAHIKRDRPARPGNGRHVEREKVKDGRAVLQHGLGVRRNVDRNGQGSSHCGQEAENAGKQHRSLEQSGVKQNSAFKQHRQR